MIDARRIVLRWLLQALLVLLPAAAPAQDAGTTYALLVGVSDYWNLDPDLRLKGPRNDVRALARLLVDEGVPTKNITVLADGIDGLPAGVTAGGDPTRAAILAVLDALPARARKGDRVIFYFSGHGSQQPDQNGDEPSGQDEIFLPIDTGRWDPRTGTVAGAIIDDELGDRMDAIRATGADVWAILDACHAATGFRSAIDDAVRTRSVAPKFLGIPSGGGPPPPTLAPQRSSEPPSAGRAAFFYASQAYERAEERPLAGPDEWDGVFTLALAKRLRQTPGASFRQVLDGVATDLKAGGFVTSQTPDLEGTMLDEPVFGVDAAAASGWRVVGSRLQAGVLDGVTTGSVLALFADPTDPDSNPIGYAAVEATEALAAALRPISWPCTPDRSGLCPKSPDASALARARAARLVSPAVDLSLRVAAPRLLDPSDRRDYGAVLAAYDALSHLGPSDLGRLKLGQADYDVGLILTDGKLALTDSTGVVDPHGSGSTPRLTPSANPAAAAQQILDALQSIARVNALYRTATTVNNSRTVKPVTATITVKRATAAERAANRCPGATRMPTPDLAVALSSGMALSQCDTVGISVENHGTVPEDVTVLYVDASFAIYPLFPEQGDANRLAFGDRIDLPIRVVTREADGRPAPTGEERIVVLSVPVEAGTARRAVLTGLAQPGLASRGAAVDPVAAFLAEAMDTTRGIGNPPAGTKLYADVIGLMILADSEDASKLAPPAARLH